LIEGILAAPSQKCGGAFFVSKTLPAKLEKLLSCHEIIHRMITSSKQSAITIRIRNMVCNCCIRVIREDLEKAGVQVIKIKMGEAEIRFDPAYIPFSRIEEILAADGFEILTDKEKILVEQIKLAVIELIHYYNNANSLIRNSDYLIEKLGYSYQHLSSVFSRHEKTTLEKFIIQHKVEKVKELLEDGNLSLSEIAFQMGYSSVQYLSTQFKNVTKHSVSDYKKRSSLDRRPLNEL
jgi:AraC family transcriptional regulator